MAAETDDFLRQLLTSVKTIAVVGLSAKEERASNRVANFLGEQGYHVIGVNPGLAGKSINGAEVFASLADIPEPVDMVDVFRNSAAAGGVVGEALALTPRPRVIWMQLGVIDEVAAARARACGVTVVMDRCPKIEIARLGPSKR
ncbi:MAG TPA: CoA-binding protein [Methylocella sp.]|nr:CoA-binding protein [Methylocella sp.]